MRERSGKVVPLHQPRRLGRYELVEKLGTGGMAEVWKARMDGPAGFSRVVVIKRILSHLGDDPGFVRMFIAEAQLSARLTHPNIIDVFEFGQAEGEYYIAMEYVRGCEAAALRDRFAEQHGPLAPGLAALVISEVCHALSYAHELRGEDGTPLRIIHRDVSPSNIMVGVDGRVKLLDFGIAKALDSSAEHTRTGTLKGKVAYVAPEMVGGQNIDHRSDLFSAGVVLHELLTGKRLFRGNNELETLFLVRDARIDPPSAKASGVPRELDEITMRALARNPAERYPSAAEMARDLERVVQRLKARKGQLAMVVRELVPHPGVEDEIPSQERPPTTPAFRRLPSVSGSAPTMLNFDSGTRPPAAQAPTRPLLISANDSAPSTLPRMAPVTTVPIAATAITPRPTTAPTLPAILKPRPSRRRAVIAGGALCGLAFCATVLLQGGPSQLVPSAPAIALEAPRTVALPATEAAEPAREELAAPSPPVASELAAPELPSKVRVQVSSEPAGADVFLDREPMPRGRTPLALELERASMTRTVRIVAKRYKPMTTEFKPTGDVAVQVALKPMPSPPPPPSRARASLADPMPKQRAARSAPRDDSDLADPFR